MKLVLVSFADAGNHEKERLILKATVDVDIGGFAVLLTQLNDGSPSSGSNRAYWFPDETVGKDDLVVLYTKRGSIRKKNLENNRTAYFFYWGLEKPVWNDRLYGAVVAYMPDWDLFKPK